MSQHYDVAVIGTQLSGVVAASLLAKRGRRVLLVDNGEDTLTYKHKGFTLPLVPRLVPNIETSPQIQRVHRELGLTPDLRYVAKKPEPSFQAVMPRHRVDVCSNRQALLDEMQLEFPDLVQPVRQFFDSLFELDGQITAFLSQTPDIPATGWRQRLRLRRGIRSIAHLDMPFESHELLTEIPPEHPVRDLLLGPLAFFGHLSNTQPSTMHAVRLIARFYRGVMSFAGGPGGLLRLLLEKAQALGVDVRLRAVVEQVEGRGRRLQCLHLENTRLSHTADYFVANTVGPFHELFPPEKRHPKLVMEDQWADPAGSLLVMNLVVSPEVLPCGMGEAVFLLNGRRQPRDAETADPPLFLRVYGASPSGADARPSTTASSGAAGDAPETHKVLSIACPIRTAGVARSPERLAAIKQQMLGRVRRVVPFLDDHLRHTSLPVDTSGWDLEEGSQSRRVDPWRLHPIYETPTRPLLGVVARGIRTYYKNVVHCGRDVLPGFGLEGEYMAGLAAAQELKRLAGRKWKSA